MVCCTILTCSCIQLLQVLLYSYDSQISGLNVIQSDSLKTMCQGTITLVLEEEQTALCGTAVMDFNGQICSKLEVKHTMYP